MRCLCFFRMRQATTVLWSTTSEPGRFAGATGNSGRGDHPELDGCRWLGKSKIRVAGDASQGRPDTMPAHHHIRGLGFTNCVNSCQSLRVSNKASILYNREGEKDPVPVFFRIFRR